MNIHGLANRLRGSATLAETLLWEELKDGAMGWLFYRQYSYKGHLLDFYCPNLKLAIEIGEPIPVKERERFWKVNKIHCLQFTETEIQCNIVHVLQTIRFAIQDLEILYPVST